jgi:tetratricopeptide (TPR) repeat protein
MADGVRFISEVDDKAVSLARDVEKQSTIVSDDLVHGRSLMTLGLVLENSGYWKEALVHLKRAKVMVTGSVLLSEVFNSIALVHYYENRLPEALDAVKEAWERAESKSNCLVDQAQTSILFGIILFSADRDAEAWKYMEISLMKNSHLGNRRDSA